MDASCILHILLSFTTSTEIVWKMTSFCYSISDVDVKSPSQKALNVNGHCPSEIALEKVSRTRFQKMKSTAVFLNTFHSSSRGSLRLLIHSFHMFIYWLIDAGLISLWIALSIELCTRSTCSSRGQRLASSFMHMYVIHIVMKYVYCSPVIETFTRRGLKNHRHLRSLP